MSPSRHAHDTLRQINFSPIGSCGEERGDPEQKSRKNVPDSTGCNNSEVSPASSPLVRGSVSQSRDQDSRTHDISSFAMGTEGSTYEVGRFRARNEDASYEAEKGSRKVLNLSSPVSVPGVNDRTCLLNALDSILDGNIRCKVCTFMRENMASKGDTPIKIANQALQPHGLYLRQVYQNFIDKPGGVEYNLLQLRKCQMVLALDLTRADGVAHHCIGWNGKALLDSDYIVIIEEVDRINRIYARMVFDKLFPKETFKDWRIVQALVIAGLNNKKNRTFRKRKRSARR